jgi:hypothetical protein
MPSFTDRLSERQEAMRERQEARLERTRLWPPVKRAPPPVPDRPGLRSRFVPSTEEEKQDRPVPRETFIVRPWPPLLDIDMAAAYAGVSRTTIKEWHQSGQLRAHVLPGIRGRRDLDKVVFERRALDRFLGLRSE